MAARLKLIWKAPGEKSTKAMKDDFCEEYEKSFPKAVKCLEEEFEELDSRKISSTNTLERSTGKSESGHLLSAFMETAESMIVNNKLYNRSSQANDSHL